MIERWGWACGIVVFGCGGSEPAPAVQTNEAPPNEEAVHRALVKLHKHAVETCFGGFGKGTPYALTLGVAKGAVASAEVRQLSSKHAPIPVDCIRDAFVGQDLAGTARTSLTVRFAVLNSSCTQPACAEGDRECAVARDIACSVVIDP